MDDVMPRRDSPENLSILKTVLEFSTVEAVVGFCTVEACGSVIRILTGSDELRP